MPTCYRIIFVYSSEIDRITYVLSGTSYSGASFQA